MTTKYVQPGNVIDYVNGGSARTAGQIILMGTRIGVCLDAIAANTTGAVQVLGVFTIAKLAADDMSTQGTVVYWDNTNKRITTTSSGNTKVGVIVGAKLNGETTARVRLNGSF